MLTTRQVMIQLQDVESTIGTLGASSLMIAQDNQLLSANNANLLQTVVPAWAIVDSSLGFLNEFFSIVTNIFNLMNKQHSKNRYSTNILKSLPKLYGNGQLLYQGMAAMSSGATNAVFTGFAIKYGIEFGIALIEWMRAEHILRQMAAAQKSKFFGASKTEFNAQLKMTRYARYKAINTGMLFAGFLTVSLGYPMIGFALLAAYALLKIAYASTKAYTAGKNCLFANNAKNSKDKKKENTAMLSWKPALSSM